MVEIQDLRIREVVDDQRKGHNAHDVDGVDGDQAHGDEPQFLLQGTRIGDDESSEERKQGQSIARITDPQSVGAVDPDGADVFYVARC